MSHPISVRARYKDRENLANFFGKESEGLQCVVLVEGLTNTFPIVVVTEHPAIIKKCCEDFVFAKMFSCSDWICDKQVERLQCVDSSSFFQLVYWTDNSPILQELHSVEGLLA